MIRAFIFVLLRISGAAYLAREIWQRKSVTIVVFHDPEPSFFREQMLALRKAYHIIPLAQYLQARVQGNVDALPQKSLVVTLDDGHKGNFLLKDILLELDIPVTIFLCSGIVGTRRHFWWLHAASDKEAQSCKSLSNADRLAFLQQRGYERTKEYADRHALTKAEIAEMSSFVDFQAHTVTHPILPMCPDAEAQFEVEQCKADLEREFGLMITALAFPNGDYTRRELSLLEKAGFSCGLSLDSGGNDARTDPFCLRRVALADNGSVSELLVKTSGLARLLRRR